MDEPQYGSWSRRRFLAGVAATAAALVGTAGLLAQEATAQPPGQAPPIRDTINGVLAFVAPGDDPYSRQQGVWTDRPGGATPGAAASLERTLDQAAPWPLFGPAAGNLPGAAAVALLLNTFAVTADVRSATGPFSAPFANLSQAGKAQVFEWLDTDPRFEGLVLKFVVNAVPTLAAFAAFSEVSAYDPVRRELTGRPVGWEMSRYAGTSDGWDEFRGYYGGIEKVEG
ncbi:twin-arginine translocation signal domain-containing protein [Rhodococcus sp. CH91]|uniref:twin-arginine translocation signal domain-containing protein n=1 Tax=Rhodococcus sp. CH91 TaxID=2910256 RepID=UPI001F4A65CA|nr:twin-arginine translocation signal domain-containing protein [Rhodococcus sp. CH91]